MSNYIENKNLKLDGNPQKLANWLNAIQITYPNNAYIPLFNALCHTILGANKQAKQYYDIATYNTEKSAYWSYRLKSFRLNTLLQHKANTTHEVFDQLATLRHQTR